MLKKNAFPAGDDVETNSSVTSTEIVFRGKLRPFDLKVCGKEVDLLQVFMQNEEEIDALILKKLNEGPNKKTIPRESGMIKVLTVQDGGTGKFERIMMFLNTKTFRNAYREQLGIITWN